MCLSPNACLLPPIKKGTLLKQALKALFLVLALLILFFFAFSGWKYFNSTRIPEIKITKSETAGHQLLINQKPFLIRGVCYSPMPIGKDYEYNFWGDSNKPWLVDGKMFQEMGGNTLRFYRLGKNPKEVRQVFDDLHYRNGMYFLVGNYLGFWNWPPPNYSNPEFCEKIKAEVLEMVQLYKNHPGVLMWVLGNENNYSFDLNVQRWSNDEIDALPDPEAQRRAKAKIYYTFVNDLAKEIKKIDPKHPVAMGVGEVASLDLAQPVCPDIDVLAMIAYRGPGFGNLFRQIKQKFDIPVVLTEWGADSYNASTQEPDEENQAQFLKLQWQDIERNTNPRKGVGNCLGGALFEWLDEWWKGNENLPHTWSVHDTAGHWRNPSYYYDAYGVEPMNMNEEWWGLVAQSEKGKKSGFCERLPKKAYWVLKELWTGKKELSKSK